MGGTPSPTPGYSDFANLSGVYLDRPALILCGGPSLPAQVASLDDRDWLRFSVNEHGYKLLGDEIDYIVALDNIPEKVYDLGPPVIGFFLWCAYRLLNFWNAGNSGMQAVWCAHMMGCNPIVIAGADCYTNGTYFWDLDAQSSGNSTRLSSHLQAWQRVPVDGKCTMATIRAVDGPLVSVFGKYRHGESERPADFVLPKHEWGSIVKPGRVIEFLRSCMVAGEPHMAGTQCRLDMHRAHEIVNLGKARYVEETDDRDGEGQASVLKDVRPASKGRRKVSPRNR